MVIRWPAVILDGRTVTFVPGTVVVVCSGRVVVVMVGAEVDGTVATVDGGCVVTRPVLGLLSGSSAGPWISAPAMAAASSAPPARLRVRRRLPRRRISDADARRAPSPPAIAHRSRRAPIA